MEAPPWPAHADEVKRRVMFALQLVDPVTGRLAFEDMIVTAPGFARQIGSASGRFVWIDVDPPAQRTVMVKAASKRRIFAPLEKAFEVPARDAGVTAADSVSRFPPEPTRPFLAAGRHACCGRHADRRGGGPDATCGRGRHPCNSATPPMPASWRANDVARTDERGQFVAVAPALGGGPR